MGANVDALKSRYTIFFDNLQIDTELSDDKKSELLDYIDSRDPGVEDLVDAANDFSRSNQLLGKTKCSGTEHQFGHVMRTTKVLERLQELLGDAEGEDAYSILLRLRTSSPAQRSVLITRFFRKRLDKGVYDRDRLKTALGLDRVPRTRDHTLKQAKVKPYLCWSFDMGAQSADQWRHQIGVLPCRLGLEEHEDRHQLLPLNLPNSTRLSRPTVLDAEIANHNFLPGGVTKPYPECATVGGLSEWVLESPKFSEVDL